MAKFCGRVQVARGCARVHKAQCCSLGALLPEFTPQGLAVYPSRSVDKQSTRGVPLFVSFTAGRSGTNKAAVSALLK